MLKITTLFYSTNDETAKKLIHAKRIKNQERALRKLHCIEVSKLLRLKSENRIGYSAIDNLRASHLEEIRNLEGSYTTIVLPKRELLICIIKPGNGRRYCIRRVLV